jgi:hypothetical protein
MVRGFASVMHLFFFFRWDSFLGLSRITYPRIRATCYLHIRYLHLTAGRARPRGRQRSNTGMIKELPAPRRSVRAHLGTLLAPSSIFLRLHTMTWGHITDRTPIGAVCEPMKELDSQYSTVLYCIARQLHRFPSSSAYLVLFGRATRTWAGTSRLSRKRYSHGKASGKAAV